jgi:integrase
LDVNFARGIQLYHEFNEVNNVPDDKQLQKLIHVLNTDSNRPICQLALYLLSTGCRLNEALSAQWKNIDVENRIWTVPSESSKSKRPRYIPLNDAALNILEQINCLETDSYVFANPKTQKPYVNVFKPWNRIRTKAGLPKMRLHDLRHMYATFCVNNGCSILEVSKLLGHADTRVSQRYSHLSASTMLKAASSVSKKLEGFMLASPNVELEANT